MFLEGSILVCGARSFFAAAVLVVRRILRIRIGHDLPKRAVSIIFSVASAADRSAAAAAAAPSTTNADADATFELQMGCCVVVEVFRAWTWANVFFF